MTLCGRAKYYRYYCTYLFHVYVRNTPLRGMGFFWPQSIRGITESKNGHGDTSSDTAVSLKKGDFTAPPVDPIFQKENGGLKCNISKPPFCAARPNGNGLVVYASAAIIKRKEPINRVPLGYGLSALRLCVWLFDNCHIELCDMN